MNDILTCANHFEDDKVLIAFSNPASFLLTEDSGSLAVDKYY